MDCCTKDTHTKKKKIKEEKDASRWDHISKTLEV